MLAEAATVVTATVTERLGAGRFRVRIADGTILLAIVSGDVAESDSIATGDRVSVAPSGVGYPGVIVGIDPALAPPAHPSAPFGRRANHPSPDQVKIDRGARPEWPTGADRLPVVGEEVYCTEGLCSVIRVLGRTGNGSRLLELRLHGGDRRPFFAAASNVLVHPVGDVLLPSAGD